MPPRIRNRIGPAEGVHPRPVELTLRIADLDRIQRVESLDGRVGEGAYRLENAASRIVYQRGCTSYLIDGREWLAVAIVLAGHLPDCVTAGSRGHRIQVLKSRRLIVVDGAVGSRIGAGEEAPRRGVSIGLPRPPPRNQGAIEMTTVPTVADGIHVAVDKGVPVIGHLVQVVDGPTRGAIPPLRQVRAAPRVFDDLAGGQTVASHVGTRVPLEGCRAAQRFLDTCRSPVPIEGVRGRVTSGICDGGA